MIRLSGVRLWLGIGAVCATTTVAGVSLLPADPNGAIFATAVRATARLTPAVAEPARVSAIPTVVSEPASTIAAPSGTLAAPAQSPPFAATAVPANTTPPLRSVPRSDRCSAFTVRGGPPAMCAPLAPQP